MFKIVSKYKNRADGDSVHFGDVVLLIDFMGRSITCDRYLRVTLVENRADATAFRFLPFVSFSSYGDSAQSQSSSALKAGHIVNFIHKEYNALLAGVSRSILTPPTGHSRGTVGIDALPATTSAAPDSSRYPSTYPTPPRDAL